MTIKQAYEVYSLTGGGYNKRHLHGYAWTKADAKALALEVSPKRYHIGVVHLVEVNGRWHRVNVHPIDEVIGNVEEAETSRIELDNLPARPIPGIWIQLETFQPQRLGLNIEKAIDLIALKSEQRTCRLYTLRTGGLLPVTFKIADFLKSSKLQEQIFFWLKHEIEYRTSRGEQDDPA